MKLKRNQRCPIHRSVLCCGRDVQMRKAKPRYETRNGVTKIPDPTAPRGYRERRSPAAMRLLLELKVHEQLEECGICHKPLTDMREVVPDHIEPRGMGGSRRDDHSENIQAAHQLCNIEKGSRRIRRSGE